LRYRWSSGWTLSLLLVFFVSLLTAAAQQTGQSSAKHHVSGTSSRASAKKGSTAHRAGSRRRRVAAHIRHAHARRARRTAKSIARSRRLQRAFVASAQLRPMAQQLAQNRTPAAYAGVTRYAETHKGDAAAAAYLALGHGYLLDHRLPEAIPALQHADAAGDALDDYATYLTAQAQMQSGQYPQAETLLNGFITKYPDSVFVPQMPVLIANLSIQQGDPQTALRTLQAHASE